MIPIPTLADMFRPDRRIGRFTFVYGVGLILLAFWALIRISEASLPAMAEALAPRGINVAFVLNMIWVVLGVLLVWTLATLSANRLRDAGRWPWWGAIAIVPLAILALLNDAIFLVSRSFVLPSAVNWVALVVFGGLAAWVFAEAAIRRAE